jgi:hypothetical protein
MRWRSQIWEDDFGRPSTTYFEGKFGRWIWCSEVVLDTFTSISWLGIQDSQLRSQKTVVFLIIAVVLLFFRRYPLNLLSSQKVDPLIAIFTQLFPSILTNQGTFLTAISFLSYIRSYSVILELSSILRFSPIFTLGVGCFRDGQLSIQKVSFWAIAQGYPRAK